MSGAPKCCSARLSVQAGPTNARHPEGGFSAWHKAIGLTTEAKKGDWARSSATRLLTDGSAYVCCWKMADLNAEAEHVGFLTESGRRFRRSRKTYR
jgi:hypothetical protein